MCNKVHMFGTMLLLLTRKIIRFKVNEWVFCGIMLCDIVFQRLLSNYIRHDTL